jgi:hypothetical protein
VRVVSNRAASGCEGPATVRPFGRQPRGQSESLAMSSGRATRLRPVWQRRLQESRTVSSAPNRPGPALNRTCRLAIPRRRCQEFVLYGQAQFLNLTGTLAAVQEPAVHPAQNLPSILSAIQKYNPRLVPSNKIPDSSIPCRASAMPTSLRSHRTMPPLAVQQHSSGEAHSTAPGMTGVDSKTGAAIHEPVIPGESD